MAPTPHQLRERGTAADQVSVRRNNLSVVLTHLREWGPRTRARVADETGLNKATVSSLVAELVARGLVREGATERGAIGRPGQEISLDGRHHVALGVEVNTEYLSALAMDLTGHVVAEQRVALDTSHMQPGPVLKRLGRLVSTMLESPQASGARTVGLGIAVPGLVESASGTMKAAPNLGWIDVPVVAQLRALIGDPAYPVAVENEANASALAEIASRGSDGGTNLVLLTGGAGVGGGVITGGRLLKGVQGFAGEVGHMRLDPDGHVCGCGGRGCWETVVGLTALLRKAATSNDPVRDPSLDVEQRLAEIRRRASAGDPRTLRAIAEIGAWLGRGASILVNIFNPEVLVLGGYFAAIGPWLVDPLEDALSQLVFAPKVGGCRVELSTLGFSAAVRGGALQALEAVFSDPSLAPVVIESSAQHGRWKEIPK